MQFQTRKSACEVLMLGRIAGHFRGEAQCIQHAHWSSWDPLGFADIGWAGSKRDAMSTSGGALWAGRRKRHLLKRWSTGLSTVALPSGEAHLYAVTKVSAQTCVIISMAADVGKAMSAKVHTDYTAPLRMVLRSCLSRMRQVRITCLWIQESVLARREGRYERKR